MEIIYNMFPPHIQKILRAVDDRDIEEIRIRIHSPVEIITTRTFFYMTTPDDRFYVITERDIEYIFNQLSEFSMYAFQEELKQGYITTRGGHRVGIGGQVVYENGGIQTVKHIRFMNIRVASDHIGTARAYVERLYKGNYDNTLIIGAPQTGKTTFLRDIARTISSGIPEKDIAGKKVAIVDERSEIAACYHGAPSFQIGQRTDVLDRCPKAEGMMMMIRAMSPEVIIVDEIGRREDAEAIMEAIHAGVTVICTAHGHSVATVKQRPAFQHLVIDSVFRHIVTLQRINGVFQIQWEESTQGMEFSK
ncbi:stage III sporulation protein AA [Alteribacillus iranensis]|uniref:Stage III sporulation protein AA n=1 Tax=Alteribacillus iranensis TaxID=930128 RepID=A0A1I1ZGV6_9BACI|nr:stage III sporulation protein AA [Alteribacillus iranensis]SFE30885.1 stage III sporulation protein AA [Alteribacillus iranensis]